MGKTLKQKITMVDNLLAEIHQSNKDNTEVLIFLMSSLCDLFTTGIILSIIAEKMKFDQAPPDYDEMEEELIDLIEGERKGKGSIYIEEELIDNWSYVNDVADEDDEHDLEFLQTLLKGKYKVEHYRKSRLENNKLKFTKIK